MGEFQKISTLSSHGGIVQYRAEDGGYRIQWEKTTYYLGDNMLRQIMTFFGDGEWRPMGASQDRPMADGLGAFLEKVFSISPRYASAIAPILVNEGFLEFRGKRPIFLRKIVSDQS
jgi:hypothetical protein